jgi:hypothetical protein
MALDMEDVAQQEHDVVDRGLVDRHGLLPRGSEWMERLGHQGGRNPEHSRCSPPANRPSMAHAAYSQIKGRLRRATDVVASCPPGLQGVVRRLGVSP